MTLHELMIKTNQQLMDNYIFTDEQKADIVNQFFNARNTYAPTVIDPQKRYMRPQFFIPYYIDGKKLDTILGQKPKTYILSGNSYELEIIRLLYLLAPHNKIVQNMVNITLERLKSTCFGRGCTMGECFDTSLVVLRFLIAVAPHEKIWIQDLINNYQQHFSEKKRTGYCAQYFELCLKELKD